MLECQEYCLQWGLRSRHISTRLNFWQIFKTSERALKLVRGSPPILSRVRLKLKLKSPPQITIPQLKLQDVKQCF